MSFRCAMFATHVFGPIFLKAKQTKNHIQTRIHTYIHKALVLKWRTKLRSDSHIYSNCVIVFKKRHEMKNTRILMCCQSENHVIRFNATKFPMKCSFNSSHRVHKSISIGKNELKTPFSTSECMVQSNKILAKKNCVRPTTKYKERTTN